MENGKKNSTILNDEVLQKVKNNFFVFIVKKKSNTQKTVKNHVLVSIVTKNSV